MVTKRTSTECNDGDPANEGQEYDAKRAKLDSLSSNTTVHDLKIELLQRILVKAVAMEVKGLRLAKSVWKEKADLTISRLRTVCWQWSNVVSTNPFRNELHRTLDNTAEESIRLEFLDESPVQGTVTRITTMNDKVYMLGKPRGRDNCITVYNRNNMTEVLDVILLPARIHPRRLMACPVSNCLYVGLMGSKSLLRITKVADHQFNIAPWVGNNRLQICNIFVSNGSLILIAERGEQTTNVVSIYDASGSLQHEVTFSINTEACFFYDVLQKSNGNLIVSYLDVPDPHLKVCEIDSIGSILRQFESSSGEESCLNFADDHGRIMVVDIANGIELLDSELNLLGVYSLQQDTGNFRCLEGVHYDVARNEIVRCLYDVIDIATTRAAVTFFRFTED